MINQKLINFYYRHLYPSRTLENIQPENLFLLDLIGQDESIIDVGCGNNFFKQKFNNLIGIDPANPLADYEETLEEFASKITQRNLSKFDVAICLGSINFGNEEDILNQISCLASLMQKNSRIYWRNSREDTHSSNYFSGLNLEVFKWNLEKHNEYAKQFNYNIAAESWHPNVSDSKKRLYVLWNR